MAPRGADVAISLLQKNFDLASGSHAHTALQRPRGARSPDMRPARALRAPTRPVHLVRRPDTRSRLSIHCTGMCTLRSQVDTASPATSSTHTHNPPASQTTSHPSRTIASSCTAAHPHASHLHNTQHTSAQHHKHSQHFTLPTHTLASPWPCASVAPSLCSLCLRTCRRFAKKTAQRLPVQA